MIPYDEPVLEYKPLANTEITERIEKYVSRLICDGDPIQIGYGSIPNAISSNLSDKKTLRSANRTFYQMGL